MKHQITIQRCASLLTRRRLFHNAATSTSPDDVEVAWKNHSNISVDLGEGAIWDSKSQRLFWIDIMGRKLMHFTPATKTNVSISTSSYIGTVVLRKSGGVVAALQEGLTHFDVSTGKTQLLAKAPFTSSTVRFNDGKCDPRGRLFVGSMLVDTTQVGGDLWRFDEQLHCKLVLGGVWIPNGVAWSADKKRMYWTDTNTYRLDVFDYDVASGEVKNRRPCVDIPKEWGSPDGITLDKEGNVWIAHWDGYRVTKWDTHSGKLLHTVHVCTARPSSVAFGGEHLTDLYITTAQLPAGHGGFVAKKDESKSFPRDDKLAGSLFVARNVGQGVPPVEFAA